MVTHLHEQPTEYGWRRSSMSYELLLVLDIVVSAPKHQSQSKGVSSVSTWANWRRTIITRILAEGGAKLRLVETFHSLFWCVSVALRAHNAEGYQETYPGSSGSSFNYWPILGYGKGAAGAKKAWARARQGQKQTWVVIPTGKRSRKRVSQGLASYVPRYSQPGTQCDCHQRKDPDECHTKCVGSERCLTSFTFTCSGPGRNFNQGASASASMNAEFCIDYADTSYAIWISSYYCLHMPHDFWADFPASLLEPLTTREEGGSGASRRWTHFKS